MALVSESSKDLSQGVRPMAMAKAKKVRDIKNVCLYTGNRHQTIAVFPVSTETTTKMKNEEFQNFLRRNKSFPQKHIVSCGSPELSYGASLVSVGSMVYCIGGFNNQVKKFNTKKPEIVVESCDNTIMLRLFPAVVSIGQKIYVIGGLDTSQENSMECPWAEFLDTNKPKGEQKWKGLKEPISRLCSPLFAVPYDAQSILIYTSFGDSEDAILYNVTDESSMSYNFKHQFFPWNLENPVMVVSDKTIYWIDRSYMVAYDFDKHTRYVADLENAMLPRDIIVRNFHGPILVHLKDELFCCFTVFSDSYPIKRGIVECTKFLVTKGKHECGEGVLDLDIVGYQSYRCDPMWELSGAVFIKEDNDQLCKRKGQCAASNCPEVFKFTRVQIVHTLLSRDLSQGVRPMAMAKKVRDIENVCLYTGYRHLTIAVFPVSTETTTKMKIEEFQNFLRRNKSFPQKHIVSCGSPELSDGASLVSVGSMVYFIGGSNHEVKKCNTKRSEIIVESCDNMIQPRLFPAVVSIGQKIYVFGGLETSQEKSMECPWAEFLDTNKPKGEQKWKGLKEPISRLYGPLFAVPYDAQSVLIYTSSGLSADAILYNVTDQSSMSYNFNHQFFPRNLRNPVMVVSDKTIYWIDRSYLVAYDFDKHTRYVADLENAMLPRNMFVNSLYGPILVHLKDELFCCFTVFSDSYPIKRGIVECTKFQVTKGKDQRGEVVLDIDFVGFQSYRCDPMWVLSGAVFIKEDNDHLCKRKGQCAASNCPEVIRFTRARIAQTLLLSEVGLGCSHK